MNATSSVNLLGSKVMTGTFVWRRSALQRWWRSGPITLHLAILPFIFATVVALIQIVAFHWLVSDIVRIRELRLKATVLHNKATWSCNSLLGQDNREVCLSQVAAQSFEVIYAAIPSGI